LHCLKTLKKAGIERVVDLVGYYKYKNATLAEGMEYLYPDLGEEEVKTISKIIKKTINR